MGALEVAFCSDYPQVTTTSQEGAAFWSLGLWRPSYLYLHMWTFFPLHGPPCRTGPQKVLNCKVDVGGFELDPKLELFLNPAYHPSVIQEADPNSANLLTLSSALAIQIHLLH